MNKTYKHIMSYILGRLTKPCKYITESIYIHQTGNRFTPT